MGRSSPEGYPTPWKLCSPCLCGNDCQPKVFFGSFCDCEITCKISERKQGRSGHQHNHNRPCVRSHAGRKALIKRVMHPRSDNFVEIHLPERPDAALTKPCGPLILQTDSQDSKVGCVAVSTFPRLTSRVKLSLYAHIKRDF
jgi:hypothetical protein